MDDELSELCTALVRVATVPDEQFCQVAELIDREVCCERSLSTFFPDNTNTCVPRLSAANRTVAADLPNLPTSAAWIIETSFPPSPIQQTRFFVCSRISRATSAFCVGEQRQATTAESFVDNSMNSCLKCSMQSCRGDRAQ